MSKQMTMGVLVGNRGFFPSHLATSGRLEIIAALEAAGIKPIVLTPEVTAHGAVETYEDAKKCAALFKSHADGHRRPHHHPAQLRRRARPGRRHPSRRSARPRAHSGHARRARQDVHRPPPRQLLRQDVHLQQPHPVRHPLLAHHAAHRSPRLARVRSRPRLVRRRLPRRSRPEEPPHRRHRRASHRIQHRPLLGEITGAQRHHRRNPRPQRSHGPHRAA